MRRALPLLALVLLFGPHVAVPQNYSPIPVAQGCRASAACIRNCENQGGQDCFEACTPARCR